MNAFGTTILIDRNVPLDILAAAFQDAHGLERGQVHAAMEAEWEAAPSDRLPDGVAASLLTRSLAGEFPLAVDWVSRFTPDVRTVLTRVARTLDAVILTDLIEVNPLADTWYALGPGGTTAILRNTDELWASEPVFHLDAQSRKAYEALKTVVAA